MAVVADVVLGGLGEAAGLDEVGEEVLALAPVVHAEEF